MVPSKAGPRELREHQVNNYLILNCKQYLKVEIRPVDVTEPTDIASGLSAGTVIPLKPELPEDITVVIPF